MKYILALFAAAVLAMPAAAQQHQHPGGGGAAHPAMHSPAMHAAHQVTRPARYATRRHVSHVSHRSYHHMVGPRVNRHAPGRHRVLHRHPTSRVRHGIHHAVNAAAKPPFRRAPRASVAGLRRNVVAARRFHAGPYRAPPGFRYRRWVFGERLPAIYFAPAFWITDFLAFDLFPPPDGFVWVRYGPDALLIDRYTGEIIQVQYGVFF